MDCIPKFVMRFPNIDILGTLAEARRGGADEKPVTSHPV